MSFLTFCTSAQLNRSAQTLAINFGVGSFVPHKKAMNHLINGPAYKYEIDYTFRTQGTKSFHKAYNYPFFGVVYAFEQSGNRQKIGNMHSLNFFGGLPLYDSENPLRYRVGLGFGYIQKPFDIENNHKNNAIGSKLNSNIQMRLEKDFQLVNKQIIRLGLGATHFSNASFQKPNLGLNFIQFYLGYGFQVKQHLPTELTEKEHEINKKLQVKLITGGGFRENDPGLGQKHFVGTFTAQVEKNLSLKSAVFVSSDNYLNYSLREITGKTFQSGFSGGYMQCFDRLRVGFSIGAYLLNQPSPERMFYNKLIVEYYFTKRIFGQFLLKSHSTTADFLSFTIGVNIR